MKTNVFTVGADGVKYNTRIAEALTTNGSYIPDVTRVVFNLKTTEKVSELDENGNEKMIPAVDKDGKQILRKDGTPVMKTVRCEKPLDNPILVTRVWWSDNTTTTVRNSVHDKITTTTEKLSDGTTVVVADQVSKEHGLMAAVVKRTCGVPDDNGEIVNANMGKIVTEIINAAYDQQLEEAKTKLEKANKKSKANARNEAKTPSKKRYSFADIVQYVGPILEELSKHPELIENFKNIGQNNIDLSNI